MTSHRHPMHSRKPTKAAMRRRTRSWKRLLSFALLLLRFPPPSRRRADSCDVESSEHTSFVTDVSAFLSHRTFHQQHHGYQHQRHHGHHQKDVEIGERRRLLLAQILECLPGELLRSNRIGCLLQEYSPSLLEEGTYSRVERIEEL